MFSSLNMRIMLNIILLFILSNKTSPVYGNISPTPRPTMRPTTTITSSDPKVLEYSFDGGTGGLVITFDQPIIASSFDSTKISIQSTRNRTKNSEMALFSTAFNNLADQGNTSIFLFTPTVNDYAKMTVLPNVGTSVDNTWLTIARGTAKAAGTMMDNREINTTYALQATTFIKDTYAPVFEAFSLDMNKCIINITFNEPIIPASFKLYGVAIQSKVNIKSVMGFSVKLQSAGVSILNVWDYQRSISASLGQTNCDLLKAIDGLADVDTTTFLSIFAPFVQDTSYNNLTYDFFGEDTAFPVKNYVPDTTSSTLLRWTLDLGVDCINLYFDEAMKSLSLNSSRILLLSGPSVTTSSQIIRIQNPLSTTVINSAYISICLNEEQIDLIKTNRILGVTLNNTYIVVEPNAICDNADNENWYMGVDATSTRAKQAYQLFSDTLPPIIKSWSIDLSNKNLIFKFNKPCVLSKIAFTGLGFQSKKSADASAEIVQMDSTTAINLSIKNSSIFEMMLTTYGFNALKSGSKIAKSITSIFATNTISFVFDTSGNQITANLPASALAASAYYPDTVNPTLISWSIDMSLNQIVFVFSEPVNITTFNASAISLSSDAIPVASSLNITLSKLSSASYVPLTQQTSVMLQLYSSDILIIKSNSGLCSLNTTCWLTIASTLCTDTLTISTSGRIYANEIMPQANVAVQQFKPDLEGPRVTSFIVDLSLGQLKFVFNKPINTNNIRINNTLVSSSATDFVSNVTSLSQYNDISVSNYVYVTVGFLQSDLNIFKEKRICTTNTTCFVKTNDSTYSSFFDVYGNSFAGFTDSTGSNVPVLAATYVIGTYIPPALTAFLYDRPGSSLILYFNEPVVQSSFDRSTFNLINTVGKFISFGKASQPPSSYSNAIVLNIQSLIAEMTASEIGGKSNQGATKNQDDTKAYMKANGVKNLFSLGNLETSASAAIREGNNVLYFRLSMSGAYVSFEFAGPVDINKLDATKISLVAGAGSVQLTNYAKYTLLTNTLLRVHLTAIDYDSIQANLRVASKDDIRVIVLSTFIIDSSNRTLSSIQSLPCSFFMGDTVPPYMVHYDLNLGTGIVDFYFSEPVIVAGLMFPYVYLASSNSTNALTVSLKGATVVTQAARSSRISVSLNGGEYPTVRDQIHLLNSRLGTAATTYLYFSSSFCYDTATPPNFVTSIQQAKAKAVRTLVVDKISPTLVSYSIDLSMRSIVLRFDEAVNATRGNPSYYTLGQSTSDPLSTRYSLASSTTNLTASTGPLVTILISTADYIAIMKLAPNLCLTAQTCYLSVKAGAIVDISLAANPIQNVFYRYGIYPTIFTPDVYGPDLLRYDFSLLDGFFILYYDKVVNCSMFDATKFTFQYAPFTSSFPEQLTLDSDCKASCVVQYNTSFKVIIGSNTLLEMKKFDYLLKSRTYSYLRVDIGGITDPFGNRQSPVNDGFALQASNYYGDNVRPRFLSYTILTQKTLVLTFSKPMNISSAKITDITFQDKATTGFVQFTLSAASTFLSIDAYKRVISYSIIDDYNTITQNSRIFSQQINTFLRMSQQMIQDTSGNLVREISSENAIALGPSLSSWNIDMNLGYLSLSFSEDVIPPYLRASSSIFVRLQDAQVYNQTKTNYINLTTSHQMTRDTSLSSTSSSQFVIKLSNYDVDTLKYNRVAYSATSSYLTVSFGLTRSLFSGTIIPFLETIAIPTSNGLQVNSFTTDTTSPTCTGFDLDLNSGQLSLLFDEPILVSTVSLTSLILLSLKGATANIREVQRNVVLLNLTTIVITTNTYDLNFIKIANKESPLSSLLIAPGAGADYFGNKVIGNNEKNPVLRRTITPDTVPPFITGFQLDLQKGIISLNLSEVIDISSFPITSFGIFSAGNGVAAVQVPLTNYSLVTMNSDFSVEIDMASYNNDIAYLKSKTDIATSNSNTFLSYSGIYDIVGNVNSTVKYIQASLIIADIVQPSLLSFDFETNGLNQEVTLYFSKALDVTTFNCASFKFSSTNGVSGNSYTPKSPSNCSVTTTGLFADVIKFTIPKSNFHSSIGTTPDTTWIQVTSSQTNRDVYGNTLASSSTIYLRVGPVITDYFIDMNLGTIVLVFSKKVVLTTFNGSALSIYSTITKKQTYLTGSLYTRMTPIFSYLDPDEDADYFGKVQVAGADLDNLKISDLKPNAFYLGVSLGLAKDLLEVSVNAISPLSQTKAVKFFPDITRPNLVRMIIDMGYETILLQFDEPIKASSVNVALLVIQSSVSSIANSIKLTSASVQTSGRNITINMIVSDAGAIKLKGGLAKNTSTAFLSFGFQPMADFAGNYLGTQPSTAAFLASNVLPDKVSPVLVSFDVDMNKGSMTFTFSEPVLARTFNPLKIVLQSRFLQKDGTYFAITGGQVSSANGFVIVLTLLPGDLNSIKNTTGLCRTRQSTYIVIDRALVVDTSFNNVTAINDGLALPCRNLNPDVINPFISSITLDANAGRITMHMSELIQLDTVDVTMVTFQERATSASLKYTLTTVSGVAPYTNPFTSTLVIVLGARDLNSLRAMPPLLGSAATTWYSISSSFVQDTFGNSLASSVLLPTVTFYPDVTNPLITDIKVDMSALVVALYFSKAIDKKRFTDIEYFIHNNKIKRYGNITTLIGSSYDVGTGGDSGRVLVTLSSKNSKLLKYSLICQSAITCFQSWSNDFAYDYASNNLPAQWDASIAGYSPIKPEYTPDSLEPVLIKWFFDRTSLQFNLFFDEPVNMQNSSQIVIYFDNRMTKATSIVLKNIEVSYLDYNSHVILAFPKVCPKQISENITDCRNDLQSLQRLVASNQQSLYITTGPAAFSDFALIANNIKDKSSTPVQESGPECGPCAAGFYVSKLCTNNADRECTACSTCDTGKFALASCSSYTDTQCELCSTCSLGFYAKTQCSATSDTQCGVCTKCDSLSYETRHCEYGLDTGCASCRSCSLTSKKAIAVCNAGKYFTWAMMNCCKDSSGVQQPCNLVTMADISVSTRNARHHWVFERTFPKIDGDYGMTATF